MTYVFESNDDKSAELHYATEEAKNNPDVFELIELEYEGDAVSIVGGKSYSVGEICSSPETELVQEARVSVLCEEGFGAEEAQVIVIKSAEWAKEIDELISVKIQELQDENNF